MGFCMYYFLVVYTFQEAVDPLGSTLYCTLRSPFCRRKQTVFTTYITMSILLITFMISFVFGVKGDILL